MQHKPIKSYVFEAQLSDDIHSDLVSIALQFANDEDRDEDNYKPLRSTSRRARKWMSLLEKKRIEELRRLINRDLHGMRSEIVEWKPHGRIKCVPKPRNPRQLIAYVFARLLGLHEPWRHIRRCLLKECDQYFWHPPGKGGPTPDYCCPEHSQIGRQRKRRQKNRR